MEDDQLFYWILCLICASVAETVERDTRSAKVMGSIHIESVSW